MDIPPRTKKEKRQESASPSQLEQNKEHQSIRTMTLKVFCAVFAIIILLGGISLFVKLTPSISTILIIPLFIIVAVTILGIMGIITPSQITKLFSLGLVAAHAGSTTNEASVASATANVTSTPQNTTSRLSEKSHQGASAPPQQAADPGTGMGSKAKQTQQSSIDDMAPSLPQNVTSFPDKMPDNPDGLSDTSPPISGNIIKLPLKQHNVAIEQAKQYYDVFMASKDDMTYAYGLFDRGKTVSDSQYDRLVNFLRDINKPLNDLLETTEHLPAYIKPRGFPLRNALYKAATIIDELASLMSGPNRALLRQEIQYKFQLLSDNIEEVKMSFGELRSKFQEEA